MPQNVPKQQSEYARIASQFEAAKKLRDAAPRPRSSSLDAAVQRRSERAFKTKHAWLMAWLGVLMTLHFLGLYLFTNGFLLTRLVLTDKSECAAPPISLDDARPGSPDAGCWHPRAFDRALVVVVDALRYDFTVPFAPSSPDAQPAQYHDAFTILHETATAHPQNAVLLPFIADPPTTTLQRLKALMTGTLPTFIDAGSNFAGSAVDEDNLVAQLNASRRAVAVVGDDTWLSLFPGGLLDAGMSAPMDSFNVWDLHTVDAAVERALFPLLADGTRDWGLLVAHMLGVDHAGHRYGPDHPAMRAKLAQTDALVRRALAAVDERTLLVVLGDHGMDAKGDHGGESDDEVRAALFLYSKAPAFGRRRGEEALGPPERAGGARDVPQIDLVPTLALLLGLPVPFGSLGAPIAEAFLGARGAGAEQLARARRVTAAQVRRYMDRYAAAAGLDAGLRARAARLWDDAEGAWGAAVGSRNERRWEEAGEKYAAFLRENLYLCRSLWARFDVLSMLAGIGVLAVALGVLLVFARGVRGDFTDTSPTLATWGGSGLVAGGGLAFVLGRSGVAGDIPLLPAVAFGAAACSLLAIVAVFVRERARVSVPVPRTTTSWITVVFVVGLAGGFASNSYAIWEDRILVFLLGSVSALLLARSLRQEDPAKRARGCYHSVLFAVLGRAASYSRLCREEQMPHCVSTYYSSASSSTAAVWHLAFPVLVAVFLPHIVSRFYAATDSFHHSARLWYALAFRASLALTAVYWTLNTADDLNWWGIAGNPWIVPLKVAVAQTALGIALLVGVAIYAAAPPFMIVAKFAPPADGSPARPPTVRGVANVLGARYFALPSAWAAAALLHQKPLGGAATALHLIQTLSLLEALSATSSPSPPSASSPPWSSALGPAALALLGNYHFFTTGHQAVLAAMQWDAAFIPLRTLTLPLSALPVALNAAGPQLLAAVAAPAAALWRLPLSAASRVSPPGPGAGAGAFAGAFAGAVRAALTALAVQGVLALATCAWAMWLRRHLMLYRVFCPRWLLASAVMGVAWVGAGIAVAGLRWCFLSVGKVRGRVLE